MGEVIVVSSGCGEQGTECSTLVLVRLILLSNRKQYFLLLVVAVVSTVDERVTSPSTVTV